MSPDHPTQPVASHTAAALSKVTPRGFYDAYPSSDLLGTPPPSPDMPAKDFLARLGYSCGDSLFYFLATELFEELDELTMVELLRRMRVARDDVEKIIAWLERLRDEGGEHGRE